MVTALADSQPAVEAHPRLGRVVEIIGPAGAGKTTLLTTIKMSEPGIQIETLPPVWEKAYVSFFVKNILALTPVLIRLYAGGGRGLSRRELAWLAMLWGWPTLLREKARNSAKVLLLDQGPVFLMAILYEFGPSGLRKPGMKRLWEDIYDRWKGVFDGLVWLDAPDEILIKRIRTRPDEHMVKQKTDLEIREFLAKYRCSYQRLVSLIQTNDPDVHLVRLDTGLLSPTDLVHSIREIVA